MRNHVPAVITLAFIVMLLCPGPAGAQEPYQMRVFQMPDPALLQSPYLDWRDDAPCSCDAGCPCTFYWGFLPLDAAQPFIAIDVVDDPGQRGDPSLFDDGSSTRLGYQMLEQIPTSPGSPDTRVAWILMGPASDCGPVGQLGEWDLDGDGVGEMRTVPFDDADGDTVPDCCDRCPGHDDNLDDDLDTVPDGCDICPGFDDLLDDDTDTVPDGCDRCPGHNDNMDFDGDEVPDGCDLCPGFDDRLDDDSDTIPDDCDICPGFDDLLDDDTDTVPDGCDLCPGFDDSLDADTDTVPDGCDLCPGFDDRLDNDTDTIPDDCDICPGFDDLLDDDSDTVPNGCDLCPGFDDTLDDDADTVPDDCDMCPGRADPRDICDTVGRGNQPGQCAPEWNPAKADFNPHSATYGVPTLMERDHRCKVILLNLSAHW